MLQRVRSAIYDAAIVGLTAGWYRAVLSRLPAGSHLLDVGIGTGGALVANAALVRERDLRVTGVDIDADYVRRCAAAVTQAGLADRIAPRLESIMDHRGGPYDAVYFSASFMLMPDPPAVLRHVRMLLRPGAPLFFTQTFELSRSRAAEVVKPLLRLVTTIDFGRVTYEDAFRRALADGGVVLESLETLNASRKRAGVLAVARAAG
jgi:SAM-dependent methyltransferase